MCVCRYLDDGRWWSDPVVAAGCMVLCLATCVLIIAELGVCGCQKELLQLQMDPNSTRESGKRGRGQGIGFANCYFLSIRQSALCECNSQKTQKHKKCNHIDYTEK